MRVVHALVVGLTIVGCGGGAQFILKSPIEDQCRSAGLNGCREIADGATLYADGKASEGEQKLGQGLAANGEKSTELKKFADGLDVIGQIPGAGQYVAPLQPAIRLIQQVASDAAARKTNAKVPNVSSEESAQNLALTPESKKDEGAFQRKVVVATPPEILPVPAVSMFWLVDGNVLSSPCRFAGLPKMQCIHEVYSSPKVVTDVIISSGCPVDVMVASRVALNFDWLVYAPAGKGAEVHAAALPLRGEHTFTVAIVPIPMKGDAPSLDVRCGVTTVWREASELKVSNGSWVKDPGI